MGGGGGGGAAATNLSSRAMSPAARFSVLAVRPASDGAGAAAQPAFGSATGALAASAAGGGGGGGGAGEGGGGGGGGGSGISSGPAFVGCGAVGVPVTGGAVPAIGPGALVAWATGARGAGDTGAAGDVSRVIGTGPSSSAIQANGAPIRATSATDTSAPSCGRLVRAHQDDCPASGLPGIAARGGSPADGTPPDPRASKRCNAASIAASRRAGRGGGGSGSDRAMSSSMAIYTAPPGHRTARPVSSARPWPGSNDGVRRGDGKGIGQPYSHNCASVEAMIRRQRQAPYGRGGSERPTGGAAARATWRHRPLPSSDSRHGSSRAIGPAALAALTSWMNSLR